ncbi:MAG TPA: cation-translocating P-type ATPase [Planctomycetota bacterium]|nr:cation-translocating P-type ATPase [Planctomycetota bacterium]
MSPDRGVALQPAEPRLNSLPLPPGLRSLTSADARSRLAEYGPNRLVGKERLAWLKRLLALVADPMALMLGCASLLYLLIGEVADGVILAAALVPVLGVDIFLEARSQSALAKLAQAVAPLAQVVRDGVSITVPTADLVPGDLLAVQEGSVVHADGVMRWAANVAIDESSLTGESEPQPKFAAAPDQAPTAEQLVFAGSQVLAGHGFAEVTATGRTTRFGNIATLVARADSTQTPLQKRTSKLVRWLTLTAIITAMLVCTLGLVHGDRWQQAMLSGISLAMAAIPEEYPLVLTLFLSVGAWRLGRHGMLVRRLASVETLGSTTVICTDKTGTLTAGQFQLTETVCLDAEVGEQHLLEIAVLACEPQPQDPMERAIDARARAHGVDPAEVRARWRLTHDYDFDPIGKHMSHGWTAVAGQGALVAAKGALEGILVHCEVTPGLRAAAEAANARMAAAGMRVLAVAVKHDAALTRQRATDEAMLRLAGLLGYRDPLRPEVPAAVAECRAAGIRLKMITGDHALTAGAIARAAGFADADAVVTGNELDELTPGAFARRVGNTTVFARISPAQKHAIVGALQAAGEVVAMTGDGINDAPALRLADIGISMGKRGTEVARAAADLVLLDDDFASIVTTVREGRHIFTNIQAAFLYILAFHIPIVSLALATVALALPLLLMPVHLVWLELIIHPVSAVVFQSEPAPPGLMQQPPRSPRSPLLPRAAVWRSALAGLALTLAVFWLYWSRQAEGEVAARSVAWACLLTGYQVMVLVEWAALRGSGGPLLPRRPVVWLIWGLCGLSLPIAMAFEPLSRSLHLQPLSVAEWTIAIGMALLATVWRAILDHVRPAQTAGAATSV